MDRNSLILKSYVRAFYRVTLWLLLLDLGLLYGLCYLNHLPREWYLFPVIIFNVLALTASTMFTITWHVRLGIEIPKVVDAYLLKNKDDDNE